MKLLRHTVLLLLFCSVGFAEDIEINGTIQQIIKLTNKGNSINAQPVEQEKEISLLNLELSDRALQKIKHRLETSSESNSATLIGDKSTKKQLGMGNVPVLDQGVHGTCVTFAVTAAIDAVLNKGDYLSQLCPLVLSRHIATISYDKNHWDGTRGPTVLNDLYLFGVVSKEKQKSQGCGGLTTYPLKGDDPVAEITATDYHQISEPLDTKTVVWSSVLELQQYLNDKVDANTTLNAVRASLDAGDRLTFGVLLLAVDKGVVGAVGKYHAENDTWVLTPEITENMKPYGGHQMVVTGYDDNAVAVDSKGRTYKGLLTLRNSWGTSAGDKGEFYMTYNYFKELATAIQRIRHVVPK